MPVVHAKQQLALRTTIHSEELTTGWIRVAHGATRIAVLDHPAVSVCTAWKERHEQRHDQDGEDALRRSNRVAAAELACAAAFQHGQSLPLTRRQSQHGVFHDCAYLLRQNDARES